MARVVSIDLGRSHQMAVCRFARKEFATRGQPTGGIIFADGVGLGKTYEALATVASWLSQRQHFKARKQQQPFRVLVLVPPGLVSKWADELLLPDRFAEYLKGWRSDTQRAVATTFLEEVAVLRRRKDLEDHRGEHRYGRIELPAGLYVVNFNLLYKEGKRVTQLHKTRWDAIIIDEAHHIAAGLADLPPYTLLANPRTATILLTATPFQLSPQDMKGLLTAASGGFGRPDRRVEATQAADDLYYSEDFSQYRSALNLFFRDGDMQAAGQAAQLRGSVRKLLRTRMVRNRKIDNRRYHVVDAGGSALPLAFSPFRMGEDDLGALLQGPGLIEMSQEAERAYLDARDRMADHSARRAPTFVAGALRQLLSTWEQFARSSFGRTVRFRVPPGPHPKVQATLELVTKVLQEEFKDAHERGWIGKVLVFTTYVGSDAGPIPSSEKAHGTAAALKRALTSRLNKVFPRASKKERHRINASLQAAVERDSGRLTPEERRRLRRVLQVFSGSRPAAVLLGHERNLRREKRELRSMLEAIRSAQEAIEAQADGGSEEMTRRLQERRDRRVQQLLERYSTRDLVARYDGATRQEERDRHLHGFNSPFAPLVLIASSVGQEGIDLQRYCRHVIHYDLEWNPAKLEQREGRVDRHGRESNTPVNVYFLLCRGTYDERIMHVMVNRFRWHQVLLANRSALEAVPGERREHHSAPDVISKLLLDLRP